MGLIVGRKAFQRPMGEGAALIHAIQDVYLERRGHHRLARGPASPLRHARREGGRRSRTARRTSRDVTRDESVVPRTGARMPRTAQFGRSVAARHAGGGCKRPAAVSQDSRTSTTGDEAARGIANAPVTQQLDQVVIRFAGDSGDGMQLAGDRFTTSQRSSRQRPGHLPGLPGRDPGPGRHPRRGVGLPGPHLGPRHPHARATRPTSWWP